MQEYYIYEQDDDGDYFRIDTDNAPEPVQQAARNGFRGKVQVADVNYEIRDK